MHYVVKVFIRVLVGLAVLPTVYAWAAVQAYFKFNVLAPPAPQCALRLARLWRPMQLAGSTPHWGRAAPPPCLSA